MLYSGQLNLSVKIWRRQAATVSRKKAYESGFSLDFGAVIMKLAGRCTNRNPQKECTRLPGLLIASAILLHVTIAFGMDKCPMAALTSFFLGKKAEAQNENRDLSEYEKMVALRNIFLPLIKDLAAQSELLTTEDIQQAIGELRKTHFFEGPMNRIKKGQPESLPSVSRFKDRFRDLQEYNVQKGKEHISQQLWSAFTGKSGHPIAAFPQSEATPDYKTFLRDGITPMLYPLFTQVGEYGPQFSESLVVTSMVLRNLLVKKLQAKALELQTQNEYIVRKYTGRGLAEGVPISLVNPIPVLTTAMEGILSANQAISQLLADRIGEQNYRDAVSKLLAGKSENDPNSVLVDYVQRLGMGMIGPITMAGKYFPHPIEMMEGKYGLSKPLKELLSKVKNQLQKMSKGHRQSGNIDRLVSTELGCPVSFCSKGGDGKSGIQFLADAYAKVFPMVDDALNSLSAGESRVAARAPL